MLVQISACPNAGCQPLITFDLVQ